MKKLFLAPLALVATATPAMAQRTYDAYPLSGRPASEAAASVHQADPRVEQQSTYREGHTQSQIAFALQAQREAVGMCRSGNLSQELNRALLNGGEQLVTSLISRVVNGRDSYYGGYRNYNSGYSQSEQDCNALGQEVYRNALDAQLDSYCWESSDEEYTRGGQPVRQERVRRQCQALHQDSEWSQGFRPRGN